MGDYADAKPDLGNLAKAVEPQNNNVNKKNNFIEERKESRAALGA